jgi:ABC-type sugar transport system substrate-binding protein
MNHRYSAILSLTNKDSDYQTAEAKAAEKTARKHGFDLRILYAEGDAINQSQQLLTLIQSHQLSRPDAILLEPVGTGMINVARAAVKAGVAWVVLNREVDYMHELRAEATKPVFTVTTNHVETGRILGRQMNSLLPNGGTVLYLQGPASSEAAKQRAAGTKETKHDDIQLRSLNGHWLEKTAYDAVTTWLKLPTSRDIRIDVVAAQNDFMAMGARRAFTQLMDIYHRKDWGEILYLGCDGLEGYGHKWAQDGQLSATIVCPTLSDLAIDLLAKSALQGGQPPALTLTEPRSFPAIAQAARIGERATA